MFCGCGVNNVNILNSDDTKTNNSPLDYTAKYGSCVTAPLLAGCWWCWGKYCGGGIQRRFAVIFFAWIWKPGQHYQKWLKLGQQLQNQNNLMTDKGTGPETPVKLFMSNDDEVQPGHTAHGASVVVVPWILQDHCLAYLWLGPRTVSSSYNIRYWGWTLYLLNMGNGGIVVFMTEWSEEENVHVQWFRNKSTLLFCSLKENQTRTSLPPPIPSLCYLWMIFVPMNWWLHSASVRG